MSRLILAAHEGSDDTHAQFAAASALHSAKFLLDRDLARDLDEVVRGDVEAVHCFCRVTKQKAEQRQFPTCQTRMMCVVNDQIPCGEIDDFAEIHLAVELMEVLQRLQKIGRLVEAKFDRRAPEVRAQAHRFATTFHHTRRRDELHSKYDDRFM